MSQQQLKSEQIDELRVCFKQFDLNGDGHIEEKELEAVMSQMGQNPSKAEVRQMIEDVAARTPERQRNGMIEFSEFVDMMERRGIKDRKQEEYEMLEAFKVFDRDGNGQISVPELKKCMATLGERMSDNEIKDMIREADADSSGYVNYDEFVKIMSQ